MNEKSFVDITFRVISLETTRKCAVYVVRVKEKKT